MAWRWWPATAGTAASPPSAPAGAAPGGEGLLAHPALAGVAGRDVLIVRGRGGRETLAEGLAARGARVRYLEVYRRVAGPRGDALDRLQAAGRHPAVLVTSGESVRNLFELAGPGLADWLRGLPFAVIAPRVAEAVRAHGAEQEPVIARGTDDAALAEAALRAANHELHAQ